jgi:hypothetical protein
MRERGACNRYRYTAHISHHTNRAPIIITTVITAPMLGRFGTGNALWSSISERTPRLILSRHF